MDTVEEEDTDIGVEGGNLASFEDWWKWADDIGKMIAYGPLDAFNKGPGSFEASQFPGFSDAQRLKDNKRYFDDYYRNTGIKPLYPGRAYTSNGVSEIFSDVSRSVRTASGWGRSLANIY